LAGCYAKPAQEIMATSNPQTIPFTSQDDPVEFGRQQVSISSTF
jgi:hypothetical protein